jgi:hypothetical protein
MARFDTELYDQRTGALNAQAYRIERKRKRLQTQLDCAERTRRLVHQYTPET